MVQVEDSPASPETVNVRRERKKKKDDEEPVCQACSVA
jgi:hypothetical protein